MTEVLIEKVKRKCYITDDDALTIERLKDIILNAIPKVKRLLGINDEDFMFEENGEEQDLFVNYCFYAWNDATDEFKNNYLDDINSIRHKYEVEQYVKSQETV